ncbi:MAG: hypothetical protein KTR20_00400 [Cellvibrionaceae bacterium]|nr:hypothetical protein [Cellvibrionaceae bacterium]
MITIGPFNPLLSTAKYKRKPSQAKTQTGAELDREAPAVAPTQNRRRKDRRQQSIRPLIEMRCGRDRRENGAAPSVDIEV